MKASRLLVFGLLSLSCVQSARAQGLYQKAYDATYETKSERGTMQLHVLSNGNGLIRNETVSPQGKKAVMIIDTPNHFCYSINAAQKMITKIPYKGDLGKKAMDQAEGKRLGAEDLGAKMVNDHMCQGWSYKTPQGSTEVWIDKEAGVSVKKTTTASGHTTETNLKTLSTNPPPESNFVVPSSGYKVMTAP